MPRMDGTGPTGQGSIHRTLRVTGRGLGNRVPQPGAPRHFPNLRGGTPRLGLRHGPYAPAVSKDREVQMLRGQAEALKQQLDAISQRRSELEGEP